MAVVWGATSQGGSDVYLAVSRDGGRQFGSPVRVNAVPGEARLGGELPPLVAVSSAAGSSPRQLVVLWTARGQRTEIKSARSRDEGRTFDTPLVVQTAGAAGDRGWPALALDSTGAAHAIWLDHRGLATQAGGGGAHAHKASGREGADAAKGSAAFYASIGRTVSPEREIATGVCYCCKTAIAVAPDGAIHTAWRHVYPGNLRDIAAAVSRDGGRSFSPPSRVSADGWAIDGCPDDGPALAVDRSGVTHIVWPTVLTNGATVEGALFYASSRDGVQFSPRTRIPTVGGPRPSHPRMVAEPDGRLVVAWDEQVNGRRIAALRAIRPAPSGATFGEVVEVAPREPATYPAIGAADGAIVTAWATGGASSRVNVRRVAP